MAFDLRVTFTGMFLYAKDPTGGGPGPRLHMLVPATGNHDHGGVVGHEAVSAPPAPTRRMPTARGPVTSSDPLVRAISSFTEVLLGRGVTDAFAGAPTRTAGGTGSRMNLHAEGMSMDTMDAPTGNGSGNALPAADPGAAATPVVEEHVALIHVNNAYLKSGATAPENSLFHEDLKDRVLDLTGFGEGAPNLDLDVHKLADVDALLRSSISRSLVGLDPQPAGRVAARVTVDSGSMTGFGPCGIFRLPGRKPQERDEMAFRTEWTIRVSNPEKDAAGNEVLRLRLRNLKDGSEVPFPDLYPLNMPATNGDPDPDERPEISISISHVPTSELLHTMPRAVAADHFPALYNLYGMSTGPMPVLRALPRDLSGPIGSAPQGCTSGQGSVPPPG